jgi:hypothetical protein
MLQLRGSFIRRRLLAVVATTGLLAGTSLVSGVVASSAAAAPKFPVTAFSIDSSNKKVHSSTHQKLRLFVFASRQSDGPQFAARTADSLSVGLSHRREAHEWTFVVSRKAIRLNASKATGRITTHRQLGRYGKIKLTLAPAGKAHKSCAASTGFTSTRKITLTGKPRFNSRSGKHGWGIVGAHKLTMNATLVVTFGTPDPDCGHIVQGFCPSVGITISSFTGGTSLFASSRPGHTARVSVDRQVNLPSPSGARRGDFLTGKVEPLDAETDASGNVTVLLRAASKHLTGTATVTSPGPPTNDTCKKVTSNSYFGATWTNGAKKLTFHSQIGPNVWVNDNDETSLEVTSPTQT